MKSDTCHRFVFVPLALGVLALGTTACVDHNPCYSPDGDPVDQGIATDMAQADAPPPRPDLLEPTITVSLANWTTSCTSYWQASDASLQFTGTSYFNSCGYGFGVECSATSKTAVNIAALNSSSVRIELQHKYEMVSGVNAPPLGAPMAIRILRGELRVYEQDPQVNLSSLLGTWAITGSQALPVRTSFRIDKTATSTLYFTFATRLDCSQYPPPQSQAWTWQISQLRIFSDK